MWALTWRPGTDDLYDPLFEHLRERHYRDQTHPLWKNYNREHFQQECLAISIAFGNHHMPVFCGSILKRDCWPKNTYRVINRFFATGFWCADGIDQDKVANWTPEQVAPIDKLALEQGELLKSQINWLKENVECDMVFVSRESKYWQQWTVDQYRDQFGLEFKYDRHQYQVCSTPNDDSCFQRIIYQGPDELLNTWNRKA